MTDTRMEPRTISDAEIERLAAKLEDWPANGKPAMDDDVHVLVANGFVAEHETKTPCRTCGTPQVTYRYMKVTPAGRLFIAAARRGHENCL